MPFRLRSRCSHQKEGLDHGQQGAAELGWRSLVVLASLYFLLSAFCYLGAFYLHAQEQAKWAGIAEHLSVAFFVAFALLLGLEYNAKKRAHREFSNYLAELSRYRLQVAEAVFEAVLGRIVPKPIAEEVQQILRMPVIKSKCEYIITFHGPEPDKPMPPGYAVLRRDLSFEVTNLLEQPTEFPVRSYYTSDDNLASAAWRGRPFHVKLEVDGVLIEPRPAGDEKGFMLDYVVQLKPHGSANIFLRGEEPVRIEAGRSSYVQSTPVEELTVSIRNNLVELIDVEVQMHHPAWQQVVHDKNLGRYVLRRAFLPGQGFEVSWKKQAPLEEVVF